MPTAAPPTGDDRVSLNAKSATTRRSWTNFGHYTIDDWQQESSVQSPARMYNKRTCARPCTAGVPRSRRIDTDANYEHRRRVSSAAAGDIRGPRSEHAMGKCSNVVGRSKSIDSYDDSTGSDGMYGGMSSSGGDAEQATPTTNPPASAINSANSVERRYIGERTQERTHSRETDSSSTRDIGNEMSPSWDVNKATKQTMSAMIHLNNGLTLPSSHRLVSAAENNLSVKPQSRQGFSKSPRYKVQPKLPAFYVKPQHRHTYANAFLASRYSALKRGALGWSAPTGIAAGVASTHATVAFSKRSRAQILRRLQENNEIKVDTKRKLVEKTNIRAKVDSFANSMAN